jgi:hypothetical protein
MKPILNKPRTEGGVAPVGLVAEVKEAEVVALVVAPTTQQQTLLPPAPMPQFLMHRFDVLLLLSSASVREIRPQAVPFLPIQTTDTAFSIVSWTWTVRMMPPTTMQTLL